MSDYKICEHCGDIFIPKQTVSQKYCSSRNKHCGKRARATMIYAAKFHSLARAHVIVQKVKKAAKSTKKEVDKL
jgi:uncharacterized radical SAM superfamily protein